MFWKRGREGREEFSVQPLQASFGFGYQAAGPWWSLCDNSCIGLSCPCAQEHVCAGGPLLKTHWVFIHQVLNVHQHDDINTAAKRWTESHYFPGFVQSWHVYPNVPKAPLSFSAYHESLKNPLILHPGFPTMSDLWSFYWISLHLFTYSSNNHWASAGPGLVLRGRDTEIRKTSSLSSPNQVERPGQN